MPRATTDARRLFHAFLCTPLWRNVHVEILDGTPLSRNAHFDFVGGFGGSIARNCGETQILSYWTCSAHWPGRVNVCVLHLHDSSAHCICYRNLLNMVVAENLPRG